jgi:4-hydroxy-tetrahydrodipicolinate reductase
MKIALNGYGKMGKTIERIARDRGHKIVATFYENNPPLASRLGGAEVIIDFSIAGAVETIVDVACGASVPLVIGTTGWLDRLEQVRTRCTGAGIGVVYAANFSPGANAMFALARHAAGFLARYPGYAAGIEERHHAQKKDSPSGTALRIAHEVESASGGAMKPAIAASRVGAEFGLHTLFFDSPDDVVEIVHRARGRDGFARGAILAAEMIAGKTGFFSFEELMRAE